MHKRKFIRAGILSLLFPTAISVNSTFAKEPKLPIYSLKPLTRALRGTNKLVVLKEAVRLEKNRLYNYNLHLRNALMDRLEEKLIADAKRTVHQEEKIRLNSFSISFNPILKFEGEKVMLEALSDHLTELGTVGCEFGDDARTLITFLISRSKNLNIVGVEHNYFSKQMKAAIKNSGSQLSNCTIIV